jgi:hypothetical protein
MGLFGGNPDCRIWKIETGTAQHIICCCEALARQRYNFFGQFFNESKYTGYTQNNGAVSNVNKKFISRLTRARRTPTAAATVQVSHALPAVRFSCLLRGRGASFQGGVAAGEGVLCAPF